MLNFESGSPPRQCHGSGPLWQYWGQRQCVQLPVPRQNLRRSPSQVLCPEGAEVAFDFSLGSFTCCRPAMENCAVMLKRGCRKHLPDLQFQFAMDALGHKPIAGKSAPADVCVYIRLLNRSCKHTSGSQWEGSTGGWAHVTAAWQPRAPQVPLSALCMLSLGVCP